MFQRTDDGFSLVEVIIAMFLFAVLSLAVLPLIIGATRLSVHNRDTVETTALADAHLAALRSQFPVQPTVDTTCAGLQLAVTRLVDANPSTLPNIVTPTGFTRQITMDPCPTGASAGKPAAILVTVRITPDAGESVTIRTRIPVSAA